MSSFYAVTVKVLGPEYEPKQLTTKYDWADALLRNQVIVVDAIEQPPAASADAPTPASLVGRVATLEASLAELRAAFDNHLERTTTEGWE